MDIADVPSLQQGEQISINSVDQNVCRKLDNAGYFNSSIPEKGRIVIFSSELEWIYDSMINGTEGTAVTEGSYIVFIGNTGDAFEYEYTV